MIAGVFDAKRARFAFAGCNSSEPPWRYAVAYARIALSVRPQCPVDAQNAFASVEACYASEPKPN